MKKTYLNYLKKKNISLQGKLPTSGRDFKGLVAQASLIQHQTDVKRRLQELPNFIRGPVGNS